MISWAIARAVAGLAADVANSWHCYYIGKNIYKCLLIIEHEVGMVYTELKIGLGKFYGISELM